MQTTTHSNINQVLKALNAYEQKGKNLAPVFDEIANTLLNTTEEAFDSETSPLDGTKWAALKGKRKGQKKLYDSGKMQDSLNVFSDNTHAQIGFNATAKGYDYPAVHQFGSEKMNVPARPFLPFDEQGDITDELRDGILDMVVEYFNA